MDLSLSRRGDYAVRAALYLARQESNEAVAVREITAAMAIPTSFAGQILADLTRAGILAARPGRGGGYWLDRDPKDVTLLEIVEATEGTLRAERCALGDGPCRWDSVCPMHSFWQGAVRAVREQLAKVTLAALRDADLELEGGVEPPVDGHRHGAVHELADSIELQRPVTEAEHALAAASSRALARPIEQRLRGSANLALDLVELTRPGYRLVVEASEPGTQGGRLELDLSFHAVDELRSTLRASVRWRGRLAHPRLAVRAVLSGLARFLEDAR